MASLCNQHLSNCEANWRGQLREFTLPLNIKNLFQEGLLDLQKLEIYSIVLCILRISPTLLNSGSPRNITIAAKIHLLTAVPNIGAMQCWRNPLAMRWTSFEAIVIPTGLAQHYGRGV